MPRGRPAKKAETPAAKIVKKQETASAMSQDGVADINKTGGIVYNDTDENPNTHINSLQGKPIDYAGE